MHLFSDFPTFKAFFSVCLCFFVYVVFVGKCYVRECLRVWMVRWAEQDGMAIGLSVPGQVTKYLVVILMSVL